MSTDPLSRVIQNTDPSGKVTQYGYDDAGELLQTTDALGHVTWISPLVPDHRICN